VRIQPALPPQAYQTFQMAAPLATHYRDATCDEADCRAWLAGWTTTVDESTDLGQRQAHYIRAESKRGFKEQRNEAGLTVFTFWAGQKCFACHKVRLDREWRYFVRGGDWRGNPAGVPAREHKRPEDWADDFAESLGKIRDLRERG
jgi:hypothetical protein